MRWEYRVYELGGPEFDLENDLNAYGKAGWELVSITETMTGTDRYRHAAVLKRAVGS